MGQRSWWVARKRLSDMTDTEIAETVLLSPSLERIDPTCVELARRVLRLVKEQERQTHTMRMEFFEGFTTAMNRHLICPLNASETRKIIELCHEFVQANYAQIQEDVDAGRCTWKEAGAEFYDKRHVWKEKRSDSD